MSEKRSPRKPLPSKAAVNTAPAGSPMDIGLLEQLVKLMAANDLSTVAIRDGDRRVVLKRGQLHAPVYHTAPSLPASQASAPQGTSDTAKPQAASGGDDTAGLVAIQSPMVGTFYSASGPDAKPFVSVGSTVDEDTDVCIIEAMKVFNNIKAETRGTVARVLVTNGQTVEFGQPLFMVKP